MFFRRFFTNSFRENLQMCRQSRRLVMRPSPEKNQELWPTPSIQKSHVLVEFLLPPNNFYHFVFKKNSNKNHFSSFSHPFPMLLAQFGAIFRPTSRKALAVRRPNPNGSAHGLGRRLLVVRIPGQLSGHPTKRSPWGRLRWWKNGEKDGDENS